MTDGIHCWDRARDDLLRLVAEAEQGSEHPLAAATVEGAGGEDCCWVRGRKYVTAIPVVVWKISRGTRDIGWRIVIS